MGHILDTVLLCEEDDEERFREIIDDMIKNKEVKKLRVNLFSFFHSHFLTIKNYRISTFVVSTW